MSLRTPSDLEEGREGTVNSRELEAETPRHLNAHTRVTMCLRPRNVFSVCAVWNRSTGGSVRAEPWKDPRPRTDEPTALDRRTHGRGRTHADWQPENWASEAEGTRATPQTGAVTFAGGEVVAG